MSLALFVVPRYAFQDDNGAPAASWKLYTYEPGTSTPKAAYQDKDGATPHTNPIILDSRGEATIYTDGLYKFVLTNSAGVTKWTEDNIGGVGDGLQTGYLTKNVAGNSNVALTSSEQNYSVIEFTGALTGNINVTVGDTKDGYRWILKNSTTGSYTLTFKTTSGTGVSVPQSGSSRVHHDGTNIVDSERFIQSGTGATDRTVQSKLRDVVSVKDFGAVGDGVTDDTSEIQAAIDYVGGKKGGVVFFPAGTYKISSTLSIGYSNVVLVGEGFDRSHDVGGQATLAASILTWAGTASGTMVDVYSPEGATNQKLVGCGVQRFYFSANGAGYGIKVRSQNSGAYGFLHFGEFASACLYLGTVATLGEARDPQRNKFANITCRQLTTAGALVYLDGDTGASPTANVSMNYFEQMDASYKDGDAFVFHNSDHNLFSSCRATRATGGTGNAIVFHGSNDALGGVSRHNVFTGFSSGGSGPIVGKGTTTYTYASYNNNVLLVDKGNATPDPTIETGASLWYSTDEHVQYIPAMNQLAIGSSASNAKTARSSITTETAYIINGSSNHIKLADPTLADVFGIAIDSATGNLRINRASGVGNFNLNNIDIYIAGTKVLGTRKTGWTAATGTATRTTFDTTTVTLQQLAERVKALIDDLISHGSIGT